MQAMHTRLPVIKSARSARLLDALREHEAQAAVLRAAYGAAMSVDSDGMLYWVAEAAKELRLGAGRKLVHPAASGNMDQSTLYRFERHQGQPESIDATVAAYADDLDIEPIEIWERALELWRAAAALTAEAEVDRLAEEIASELDEGGVDDQPGAARPRGAADAPATPRTGEAERRARSRTRRARG
jgi:transcriptional regulator of aromatic amino acid metabolism